jgi:hypothetical protein
MPSKSEQREKVDRTATVAGKVIEAERAARQEKPERLRALRTAREAEKTRPEKGKAGSS